MEDVKIFCQEHDTLLHLSGGVPISHDLKQVIVFNNHQNAHLLNSMESLMHEVLTIVSDQDTPDLSPDPTYEKQYGQFKTYNNVKVQKTWGDCQN